MPGGGWNHLAGARIFHHEPTECPRCEGVYPLWHFQFKDPYIRRDFCVHCQVKDERQELHEACLERKLERAEQHRRKDLKKRITSYRSLKKRRRDYARKQCEKEGKQRYVKE